VPTVRAAAASDIPTILGIWAASEAEPTVTDDESSLRRLLHRDPDALLVVELQGSVVGTLIATWDGWRGHFYRLAVLPQQRRRGLATELVRTGEERLLERGARRLNAIVVDGQDGAVDFWGAAGYQAQSHRLRFVKNAAADNALHGETALS
jgi:ribosomal protein S18 acetylase RimI-like enzyme